MPDLPNTSYYAATANVWQGGAAEPAHDNYDVIVVGGGFTGLAAALACAERGRSVALVEAQTIGFGASGRNGGQLIPGLRWSMREIATEFGRERAQAIFDLAYGAVARVNHRVARHDIKCDLKRGHLEAAYRPRHFAAMQRDSDFLATNYGWEADIVQPQDMGQHIVGGDYHGGIYDAQGGHFHPLNYALGLASAAAAAGVHIFEQRPVRGWVDQRDRIELLCDQRLTGRQVIVAADSWTHALDRTLGRYTIPIMNYNIATAPLTNADELLPSDAAVADSRFVLNYFRLSADKRLIFGGGEKYVQTPPADIAAFVRKHMVRVFPSLAGTSIDYSWGGAVGVTMNRLPHMGRRGNVFFAHGFSGHGALVTTLAGELLAEAAVGTMERFDVFASLPHRPFPGGRWLARPLATLGLLWHAMRDRL